MVPEIVAENVDEATPIVKQFVDELVADWGGTLLEFYSAVPCIHDVMTCDHREKWSEAWYGAEISNSYFSATWLDDAELESVGGVRIMNDVKVEPLHFSKVKITVWFSARIDLAENGEKR